jgi:hypothetical protein
MMLSEKKDDDGEVHDDVSIDSKEEECNEEEDEKGSESPEKTVEELNDGWDWRAEDRVKATPTSTDELKEPGSLLKHLHISSVPLHPNNSLDAP